MLPVLLACYSSTPCYLRCGGSFSTSNTTTDRITIGRIILTEFSYVLQRSPTFTTRKMCFAVECSTTSTQRRRPDSTQNTGQTTLPLQKQQQNDHEATVISDTTTNTTTNLTLHLKSRLSHTITKPNAVGKLDSLVAWKQSSCLPPASCGRGPSMQVVSSMLHQLTYYDYQCQFIYYPTGFMM